MYWLVKDKHHGDYLGDHGFVRRAHATPFFSLEAAIWERDNERASAICPEDIVVVKIRPKGERR